MSEHYPIHLYQHTSQFIEYLSETEQGTQYYVIFRPAQYQFKIDCVSSQHVFEVSFNAEPTLPAPDYHVRNTIIHLIEKFINEQRSQVLYVCDNLDQREFSRQRLFARWFNKSHNDAFQHDYRIIEIEEYTVILGIVSFLWDTHFYHYFEQIENTYL